MLSKVADFDDSRRNVVMKKLLLKELDIFEYEATDSEEERHERLSIIQVKQYEPHALPSEPRTPLAELLPKSERGKGDLFEQGPGRDY